LVKLTGIIAVRYKSGEATEEEGVREQDEIDELAEGGFPECEAGAGDEAEIAGDEGDGDGGRSEEEVVHRMEVKITESCYPEEHVEEEKQREVADLRGLGAGLEFLGHGTRNLIAAEETLVPLEVPSDQPVVQLVTNRPVAGAF